MDENINVEFPEFTIADDSAADWAVRKILEEEAERDRLIDLAKTQIEDLKATIEDLKERCENNTGFLKSKLAAYFETVPHKETKTQESYKLLSGKLVKKKAGFEYKYEEEELTKFLEAENMAEFIDVKIKPRWGEFKKALTTDEDGNVYIAETGEMVDVIKAVEVPASFTVK